MRTTKKKTHENQSKWGRIMCTSTIHPLVIMRDMQGEDQPLHPVLPQRRGLEGEPGHQK